MRVTPPSRSIHGSRVDELSEISGGGSTDHHHDNLEILDQLGENPSGLTFRGENPNADLDSSSW